LFFCLPDNCRRKPCSNEEGKGEGRTIWEGGRRRRKAEEAEYIRRRRRRREYSQTGRALGASLAGLAAAQRSSALWRERERSVGIRGFWAPPCPPLSPPVLMLPVPFPPIPRTLLFCF